MAHQIVPMAPRHVEGIAQVLRAVYGFLHRQIDKKYLRNCIKKANRYNFVAIDGNEVVGFIQAVKKTNLYIEQFAVLPSHRGQGWGRRLLQRVIQVAREDRAKQLRTNNRTRFAFIDLHVPATAAAAIALYERNDFKKTSKQAKFSNFCDCDAYRMQRRF